MSQLSGLKRLAAKTMIVAFLATTVLVSQAAPAAAQKLGADGKVYAVVNCNMWTHNATVRVSAMVPWGSRTAGLYFSVSVFAKARFETSWNLIKSYTSLVKTWRKLSSGIWVNNPKALIGTIFSGSVRTNYDVLVQYQFRSPAATTWSAVRAFVVPGDGDSVIYQTAWDGLTWTTVQAGDCYL